jgi:hypothetical protein
MGSSIWQVGRAMITNGKPGDDDHSPDASLPDGEEWSLDTQDLPTRESDPTPDRSAGMTEDQFKKAAGLCALVLLVLAGTGLLLERVYPQDPKPVFADCAPIDNAAQRLACYDKFAHDSATGPAKGAAAPAVW